MAFADLGLGPAILKAVEESGYVAPTPIQEQAIPIVLMGRDVLGVAQTGTGKTASFVLPMLEVLAAGRAKARMPRSLILEPTRELAAQVAENFEKYGKYHKLTMALLIGGESFGDQEKALDRGVDVLIATPGRLMDLFERGRILLSDCKTLVIDEADRMLDMGFIPDVEKIVSLLPRIRQTLFFSATMPPEIRRLADAFLINPKQISVSAPASVSTSVKDFVVTCSPIDKREVLRHLLRTEDVKNALIFCNRKRDVDILYKSLTKHGFDAVQLHGDMAQSARTETLERFKANQVRLMVCSDVAARGIDISGLSHVFNFDVPNHPDSYVHRIGRTGRAGNEGRAFTIATREDGKFLSQIIKLIGREIPRMTLEGIPEERSPAEEAERAERKPSRERGGRSRRGGRREERTPRIDHAGAETAAVLDVLPDVVPAETPAPAPEPVVQAEAPVRAPRGERRDGRQQEPRRDRQDRDRHDREERSNVIGFGDNLPDFMARSSSESLSQRRRTG
ncbi:MAG TPA: DEAD/DEAH box helicase [Magnetospirillaceae bacterium]|jgi:superfamily II DNA/RNA helicase